MFTDFVHALGVEGQGAPSDINYKGEAASAGIKGMRHYLFLSYYEIFISLTARWIRRIYFNVKYRSKSISVALVSAASILPR